MFARLDRFVCNHAWQGLFPYAEAKNLEFAGSDHRTISMVFDPVNNLVGSRFMKRFTFEHKWLLEDEFSELY